MRLIILARNHIHSEISDVDYAAKNTGIGDVLANKVSLLRVRVSPLVLVVLFFCAQSLFTPFWNAWLRAES